MGRQNIGPGSPESPGPITLGCANAVAMTGQSWSAVRRTARELGLRELRVSERRVVIDATAYLEALRGRAQREQPEPLSEAEELERLRSDLGWERVS